MPTPIPLKVVRVSGDTSGLAEYSPNDKIPMAHLPPVEDLGAVLQPDFDQHVGDTNNPHGVNAVQIGAASQADFDNHEAAANPHSVTAAQTGAVPIAQKGAAQGVATLDAGGKIPAAQIPAVALPTLSVVTDSAARTALIVQEGDEAKQINDGSHWVYDGTTWHQYPPQSIFGQGLQRVNEYAVSSTTSTTFQTKATLAFPVTAGHVLRMGWNYCWNYNSTTYDFNARILLDGSEYISHRQEPKDASGAYGSTGTNQRHQTCGFDYINVATTGTMTIQLQWRSTRAGTTASIWEARLEVWRVQ